MFRRILTIGTCLSLLFGFYSFVEAATWTFKAYKLECLENQLIEITVGAMILDICHEDGIVLLVAENVNEEETEFRRIRARRLEEEFNPDTGPYSYIGHVVIRDPLVVGHRATMKYWIVVEDMSP